MTVEAVMDAARDLIKTIDVTDAPGVRVWSHPGETSDITDDKFPFVVVSKLNAGTGSWQAHSYGTGQHKWDLLVAVYLREGPIVVTDADPTTAQALEYAFEWYKALADLLFANLTLSGTAIMIGDGEGTLFEYVTDNIIWNGKQHFGHLFSIPVLQTEEQGVSA